MALKWKILIAILVLWLCGTIGLAWQAATSMSLAQGASRLPEILKLTLLMLGGLGVVVPSYLNIWQTLENSQLNQQQANAQIIENTFSLIQDYDGQNMLEARKFTRRLTQNRSSLAPDEIKKQVTDESTLTESVILMFNYWDEVRVSVIYKRVNAKLIRETFEAAFKEIYHTFLPWIEAQPEKSYLENLKQLHKFFDTGHF